MKYHIISLLGTYMVTLWHRIERIGVDICWFLTWDIYMHVNININEIYHTMTHGT